MENNTQQVSCCLQGLQDHATAGMIPGLLQPLGMDYRTPGVQRIVCEAAGGLDVTTCSAAGMERIPDAHPDMPHVHCSTYSWMASLAVRHWQYAVMTRPQTKITQQLLH
jgi:hypothetical protein